MTNREWLDSLSNIELARAMTNIGYNLANRKKYEYWDDDRYNRILDKWLNQEKGETIFYIMLQEEQ